jgi:hypothetical protein
MEPRLQRILYTACANLYEEKEEDWAPCEAPLSSNLSVRQLHIVLAIKFVPCEEINLQHF